MSTVQRTRLEVADYIEQFLNGTGGKWDWDDFTSVSIADDYLETVRIQCRELWLAYPPQEKGHYCSEAGFEVMRGLVATLRASK